MIYYEISIASKTRAPEVQRFNDEDLALRFYTAATQDDDIVWIQTKKVEISDWTKTG